MGCLHCGRVDVDFKPRPGRSTRVCRDCVRSRWRAWYHRNIVRARAEAIARSCQRSCKIRAFVRNLKAGRPCKDCENIYPYFVMDFDHREGKLFSVSQMVARKLSLKRILEEIAKCDLVCANCHRLRSFSRLGARQPPLPDAVILELP
jgi:hypothetical protein